MDPVEEGAVLAGISEALAERRRFVLATIVSVDGSTYRRPGARLLMVEGRDPVGNLSGGCLEGEVEQQAMEVLASGSTRLERYDLSGDDEAVLGWGLGCNGAIDVLMEPGENATLVAQGLQAARREGRSIALVTVVASDVERVDVGGRIALSGIGSEGSLGAPWLDRAARRLGEDALDRGATGIRSIVADEGKVSVFVEVFRPPPALIVCGAGPDVVPVVRLATNLGWETTVVDHRRGLPTTSRLPDASSLIHLAPDALASIVEPGRPTFAVVMSHNYLLDRDYLQALLRMPVPYIGVLGPRERTRRLLRDLAERGLELTEADRSRIHGPAGLDLGGEGPEQVALAIVAEVLAAANSRRGGPLRDRTGPIHDAGDGAPGSDRRTDPVRVEGVVLAAGASTRFGRPKQLVELDGKRLVQHVIDYLEVEPALSKIMVVVGHEADRVVRAVRLSESARIVRNERFAQGLSTSLVAAVEAAAPDAEALLVVLGDQPLLPEHAVQRVIDRWRASPTDVDAARATYEGVPGHPVLIARRIWPRLLGLKGDAGARVVIERLGDRLVEVEMRCPAPADVDTGADYRDLLDSVPRADA